MLTINQSIIKYLEKAGCGTFGTDLYYARVPDSKQTPVEVWWVVPQMSTTSRHNITGEDTLRVPVTVYFRSMSARTVDEKLFALSKYILKSHCANLDEFKTVDIELRTTQQNLYTDEENRAVGSISLTFTIYDIAD